MIRRLLSRLLSPPQPKSCQTPGSLAAETAEEKQRRELDEQLDSWLTTIKTDPAASTQLAFLKRLLRHNPADPLDSVAVSAHAFCALFRQSVAEDNLAFFVERILHTSTPSEIALSRDFILCLAQLYGDEAPTRILPLLESRLKELEDQRLATVLGTDVDTGQDAAIPFDARFQATSCFGATGTGKTTLILNMILSDIRAGHGLALLELHSDLTKHVIAAMPEEMLEKVLYLDITDSTSAFGLNFYEVEPGADATQIAKVASFVQHLFEVVWASQTETTPRLSMVLRNTTRVLIENPGMTFAEIGLLLWEDGVREKLLRRVSNTQTKLFWSQYNRKSPRDREELIASTINKVDSYLNEPLVARIVSQAASTINVRKIMDEGKILLVNLSPQLEEPSRLIGAALLGRLLMASFSRTDTPPERRRPFMIYCDEYQRFATTDFAVFLSEARKFRISTVLATQTLEFLDDRNRATALQAGTLVVMRVSGEDSKMLAASFDATPTPALVGEEPIRAPAADPIGHLVRHGSGHPTVQRFVADYLMPLETLLKKVSSSTQPFGLGCTVAIPGQVIDGRSLLNEALATCMREGRADIPLAPLALFVLGGASDPESTYVFYKDLRHDVGLEVLVYFLGFYGASDRLGKPDFLMPPYVKDDTEFLKRAAKTSIFDSRETVERRIAAFLRMQQAIRATMAVLAKDPLLVDTGLFQPKYQLRTYQDQENLVANELSQLPNYTAKVKLLSGEHLIKTHPAPVLLPEHEVEARIKAIKQRMLQEGYTTPAAAVEEAVRKRHEALRSRPPGNGQQANGNRRGGPKPPP